MRTIHLSLNTQKTSLKGGYLCLSHGEGSNEETVNSFRYFPSFMKYSDETLLYNTFARLLQSFAENAVFSESTVSSRLDHVIYQMTARTTDENFEKIRWMFQILKEAYRSDQSNFSEEDDFYDGTSLTLTNFMITLRFASSEKKLTAKQILLASQSQDIVTAIRQKCILTSEDLSELLSSSSRTPKLRL